VSLTDEQVTEILGPKCPDCGWRRGQHRPGRDIFGDPCPRWTDTTEETQP
jgi:hypothetical protein